MQNTSTLQRNRTAQKSHARSNPNVAAAALSDVSHLSGAAPLEQLRLLRPLRRRAIPAIGHAAAAATVHRLEGALLLHALQRPLRLAVREG